MPADPHVSYTAGEHVPYLRQWGMPAFTTPIGVERRSDQFDHLLVRSDSTAISTTILAKCPDRHQECYCTTYWDGRIAINLLQQGLVARPSGPLPLPAFQIKLSE